MIQIHIHLFDLFFENQHYAEAFQEYLNSADLAYLNRDPLHQILALLKGNLILKVLNDRFALDENENKIQYILSNPGTIRDFKVIRDMLKKINI